MKALIAAIALSIALAGCDVNIGQNEQQALEQSMRESLSNQMNVQDLSIARTDDDHFAGYVVGTDRNGRSGRLNCLVDRRPDGTFHWVCSPTIDAQLLRDIEGQIRSQMAQQGEVLAVHMERANDENHMTGSVTMRGGAGPVTLPCTAERDATATSQFNFRCRPEGSPTP